MKKILILVLVFCTCISCTAQAFDIEEIGPETSFLDCLNIDVADDMNYLKDIAMSYSDRFVVTEEEYIDISSIDKFYASLSKPLTLLEIDNGKPDFNTDMVFDEELKRELNLFKVIGGLSGCKVAFEPVCYFKIYRNIELVGGYTKYERTYSDASSAYWQYICKIEDMTKEIVPYHARISNLEKTRQMYNNMDNDSNFKVFLLVDGAINSIWERGVDL